MTATIFLKSCAQQVSACPQAVSSTATDKISSIVGGFIEAEGDPRLGKPKQAKMYCTAAMGTVDGGPVLYGARHCFRLGSFKKYTFHRFENGEYRPEPITFPQHALAERIKDDVAVSHPQLKERLREILDGGPPMALSGDAAVKRCLEKIPSGTSACFTGLEFTVTRLGPQKGKASQGLSSRQVAALESLDFYWRARAISSFQAEIRRCETGKVDCDEVFYAQGKAAWERYFARTDWARVKTSMHTAAFDGIASVWSELDEKRAGFAVAGNFTGSNAFGTVPVTAREVAPDTPPSSEQTLSRWQDNRPYSRTFFLRSLAGASAPLKLSAGDSGSFLLADGLPIAVLSHIDGKETSGGASVVALPVRKSSAGGGKPTTATAGRDSASTGNPQEHSSKECTN